MVTFWRRHILAVTLLIDLMDLRNIALLISYDGADFVGFARQPDKRSVQQVLEDSWLAVSGEPVRMVAAGRTDSGVHAVGHVVHFHTGSDLSLNQIPKALNSQFSKDIAVRDSAVMPLDFDACQRAISKHYIYSINTGSVRSPLGREYSHWVPHKLDVSAMREALPYFLGTHDYESFAAAGRTTSTTIRTVTHMHIQLIRGRLFIHVRGKGFLYKMVRNMIGALLEIGKGRRSPIWIKHLLEAKDRSKGGVTAPAHGLFLYRVHYSPQLFPPSNFF